jgi:hypothetical protein
MRGLAVERDQVVVEEEELALLDLSPKDYDAVLGEREGPHITVPTI